MHQKSEHFRQSPCGWLVMAIGMMVSLLGHSAAHAQVSQCDPTKVMTYESCARCHVNEINVWKNTPHFQTFEQLSRKPRAKEICRNLGLRSPKRSNVCIDCHYTVADQGGKLRAVSGISCESCHGAAKDWLQVHNDYGGPTATKENESAAHREQRFKDACAAGMRNTRNLYSIASSCFRCHTVPNENLVNQGGHLAGSDDFELVTWSQGRVRHNFLRTDGKANAKSTQQRLRVMFVIGLMADLEFSTRATAKATEKSNYGMKVASRAARVSLKLYELQQSIKDPFVQRALEAFALAELRVNNSQQLTEIADRIRDAGNAFATANDGSKLAVVDSLLPDPSTYR